MKIELPFLGRTNIWEMYLSVNSQVLVALRGLWSLAAPLNDLVAAHLGRRIREGTRSVSFLSFSHYFRAALLLAVVLIGLDRLEPQLRGGTLSEAIELERVTVLSNGFVQFENGRLLDNGTFFPTSLSSQRQRDLPSSLLRQLRAVSGKVIITEQRFDLLRQQTVFGESIIKHWARSAQTYPVQNLTYVEVCVAGHCPSSIVPNLRFVKHPNWSKSLVVSVAATNFVGGTNFFDDQRLFVSFGVQNDSSTLALPRSATVNLAVNGTRMASWQTGILAAGASFFVTNHVVGPLTATIGSIGPFVYFFTIEIDSDELISETVETDNEISQVVGISRRAQPSFVRRFDNLSASKRDGLYFTITLTNSADLILNTFGGFGDLDLYVGYEYRPTAPSSFGGFIIDPGKWDHLSVDEGNNELIRITNAVSGSYHVLAYAYGGSSGSGFSDATMVVEGFYSTNVSFTLFGKITASDTGEAIGNAIVEASLAGQKRTAVADSGGAYVFPQLRSGRYSLRVWKTGFLPANEIFDGKAGDTVVRHVKLQQDRTFSELLVSSNPGAIGSNPTDPALSYSPTPVRGPNKDSLVLVTHGWQPLGQALEDVSWVTILTQTISNALTSRGLANWQVDGYYWQHDAWPTPATAFRNGEEHGKNLGRELSSARWNHVHLIGHSAGAALIQAASEIIKSNSPVTTVHSTFLDAFLGPSYEGRETFGRGADWSDSYFSHDIWDGINSGTFTEGPLAEAYNVDVTWLDASAILTRLYCPADSFSTPAVPCGYQALSTHSWPREFYLTTVSSNLASAGTALGFALSKEGGGWDKRTTLTRGEPPSAPDALGTTLLKGHTIRRDSKLLLNVLPFSTSSTTDLDMTDYGFSISTKSSATLLASTASNSSAWVALGLSLTGQVNFMSFDAELTGAAGMLSVYLFTNRVAWVDGTVTPLGLRRYVISVTNLVPDSSSNYLVGFRLDSFTNVLATAVITNLTTGYIGPRGVPFLAISPNNGKPILAVHGDTGAVYLVQGSPDLVDWKGIATFVGTNRAVHFEDLDASGLARACPNRPIMA